MKKGSWFGFEWFNDDREEDEPQNHDNYWETLQYWNTLETEYGQDIEYIEEIQPVWEKEGVLVWVVFEVTEQKLVCCYHPGEFLFLYSFFVA